jgi:hypothetical protein
VLFPGPQPALASMIAAKVRRKPSGRKLGSWGILEPLYDFADLHDKFFVLIFSAFFAVFVCELRGQKLLTAKAAKVRKGR